MGTHTARSKQHAEQMSGLSVLDANCSDDAKLCVPEPRVSTEPVIGRGRLLTICGGSPVNRGKRLCMA